MSLSEPTATISPVKRFLRVKSGSVNYYDKEAKDNVDVEVPLSFVVLDQLATIKGWSDNDQSGYWSNEVKRVGEEELTIRTSKGVKKTGIWKEIKNEPAVSGAKFNSSVYIAVEGDNGLELQNISFSGAALNAWIEFVNENSGVTSGKNKVVISGFDDAKKGAVKYQTPHFEIDEISADELEEATELDKELQAYIRGRGKGGDRDEPRQSASKDVVLDDISDEPIDLSEIPF